MVIQTEAVTMYGPQLIEMAQVAEQEHMQHAVMARARAQARRERRRLLGPGRVARAWSAFKAPRDTVIVFRRAGDGAPADLTPCADC
jgi:hypothetical protein